MSEEKKVRYIRQEGIADCVLACVSMLTNLPMEKIKSTLPYDPEEEIVSQGNSFPMGLSESEIPTLLNNLGLWYQTELTREHILSNLDEADPFSERWERCALYSEEDLKRNLVALGYPAILVIETFNNHYYHMVFFDGKVVWDPQAESEETASSNIRENIVRVSWVFNPDFLPNY